jgi:hypothetical protein
LLASASRIIGHHVRGGSIVYMRPSDWKNNTTPQERSRWGSAYGVCMELLLGTVNELVMGPERVSVFLEDGHVNADDAVTRIRNYKADTEPMEYPELAGDGRVFDPEHSEMKARMTKMRVGRVGLVPKSALPTQAADLLAYLVGPSLRPPLHGVFEGVLDDLLPRTTHVLSAWGPRRVSELAETMRAVEAERAETRAQNRQMKRFLRDQGLRVYQLPWGIVTDRGPEDSESEKLRSQIDAIWEKFNRA